MGGILIPKAVSHPQPPYDYGDFMLQNAFSPTSSLDVLQQPQQCSRVQSPLKPKAVFSLSPGLKTNKQTNPNYILSISTAQSMHSRSKREESGHSKARLNPSRTKATRLLFQMAQMTLPLQLCNMQHISLSWVGSTPICNSSWQVSHCSGISNSLESPWKHRRHLHSFMHWPLQPPHRDFNSVVMPSLGHSLKLWWKSPWHPQYYIFHASKRSKVWI